MYFKILGRLASLQARRYDDDDLLYGQEGIREVVRWIARRYRVILCNVQPRYLKLCAQIVPRRIGDMERKAHAHKVDDLKISRSIMQTNVNWRRKDYVNVESKCKYKCKKLSAILLILIIDINEINFNFYQDVLFRCHL